MVTEKRGKKEVSENSIVIHVVHRLLSPRHWVWVLQLLLRNCFTCAPEVAPLT